MSWNDIRKDHEAWTRCEEEADALREEQEEEKYATIRAESCEDEDPAGEAWERTFEIEYEVEMGVKDDPTHGKERLT